MCRAGEFCAGFLSAVFVTRYLCNSVAIAESASERWEICADLIGGGADDCSKVSESWCVRPKVFHSVTWWINYVNYSCKHTTSLVCILGSG